MLKPLFGDDGPVGEDARNSFRYVNAFIGFIDFRNPEKIIFRRLLALALIPAQYVRRGFGEIVDHAPAVQFQRFLGYFCSTYIGLSAFELDGGVDAFEPAADVRRRSSISTLISDHVNYTLNPCKNFKLQNF